MRRVSSQRTTSASRSSRSTRSVTSSRFPIGVAQTASGIYASASNATRPAPISPAVVPSSARTIATRSPRRRRAPRAARPRAPDPSIEVAGRAEAAADDDELRVEDVDERRDPGAELAADPVERLARLRRRPRSRAGRGGARRRPARTRSCASSVAATPVTYASRWPRPVQVPWHGSAVELDHDVAELGPAAVELAVEHDAAADSPCRA